MVRDPQSARPGWRGARRLILHLGAKVTAATAKAFQIADPKGLLEWLVKDRCLVTFLDGKDTQAKRAALQAILRQWIRHV